jgi:carbamoyltransferase
MISIGINYSKMHDSSACIVRDGELLFAIAEERISRIKHDSGYPATAIAACLEFAKLKPEQIDEVCFGWPEPSTVYGHDLKLYATGKWPVTKKAVLNSTLHYASMRNQAGGAKRFSQQFPNAKPRFRYVEHHLAHALSAYSFSGFDDAAVVVMDGRGAWEATSIWRGRGGRLEHVETIDWPNSLGLFYARFTEFLGFQPYSDEWKVMGLAPYGQPGIDLKPFIETDADQYKVNVAMLLGDGSGRFSGWPSALGGPREAESDIDQQGIYKDIAWAVQDECEKAMMNVVRGALARCGSRNLCLAGGVALNSKANGKIAASGMVDRLFVQPAASDDGVALGAAMVPFMDNGGRAPIKEMRHAYYGTAFDDDQIEKALVTYKVRHAKLSDVAGTAAEFLSNGKILGWYQGRMEFGPRALGCRSILADPRDPEMNIKVNNAVKFREWWRPFAPSFKYEAAPEYLESAHDSPFMILTAQVRPEKRNVIPSVTHVDGSARPQTVEKEINPIYYRLLDEFGKRTGVPVIMNTSFNLRGEAIVNTPTDAIRTFFSSGMDALFLGSYVVEK